LEKLNSLKALFAEMDRALIAYSGDFGHQGAVDAA
jgi:PP-loop superfamily ATP-utilizing enzyme